MVALALLAQLAGCGGNAKHARKLLLAGQAAFATDSNFVAMVSLQQARDEALRAGDKETHFEATVYLAMIYDQAGQYEKSYELLRDLEYVEATTNPLGYSSQYYYRMMGLHFTRVSHNLDSAIYYGQKAIDLDQRMYPNDTAFRLTDMSNLAESYMLKGDTARAWDIVRQVEASPRPAYCIYLSQAYYIHSMLSTNLDTAYHYALMGLDAAAFYHAHDNEIACLQRLCQIDSIRHGLPAVYVAHKQQADSCIEEQQGAQVTYKMAVLQEQDKIERMRQQSHNERLVSAMLVTMLLLTLAGAAVLLRLSRRNARTRQQLAEAAVQREKLENELLQLRMKKNEQQLQQAHKDNVAMTELITEMQHTLVDDDDQSLLALETTLKTQHADFMQRVAQQYPELTENDVRLMGFIRMGVKPKVMSMALNISMKSLNSARYRLRKRLKLDNEVNLNDFIQSI